MLKALKDIDNVTKYAMLIAGTDLVLTIIGNTGKYHGGETDPLYKPFVEAGLLPMLVGAGIYLGSIYYIGNHLQTGTLKYLLTLYLGYLHGHDGAGWIPYLKYADKNGNVVDHYEDYLKERDVYKKYGAVVGLLGAGTSIMYTEKNNLTSLNKSNKRLYAKRPILV